MVFWKQIIGEVILDGGELCKLRMERRLSQAKFGKQVGISQGRICQLELGNRSISEKEEQKIIEVLTKYPIVEEVNVVPAKAVVMVATNNCHISFSDAVVNIVVRTDNVTAAIRFLNYALDECRSREP
ncbi:MAG: helix-turn-helix transcriptional regulator [Patescibacteria group bacterium]